MANKLISIRKNKDFQAIRQGNKVVCRSAIIQNRYNPNNPANLGRIGITVSRKIGKATVRNRTKRRLREAVRLLCANLINPGYDYVIIARKEAETIEFSRLGGQLQYGFTMVNKQAKSRRADRKVSASKFY